MCIIAISNKMMQISNILLIFGRSPGPPPAYSSLFVNALSKLKKFFCHFPMNDIFCCSFTASLRLPHQQQHRFE